MEWDGVAVRVTDFLQHIIPLSTCDTSRMEGSKASSSVDGLTRASAPVH